MADTIEKLQADLLTMNTRGGGSDERTTAIGLYHYALSYRRAADALMVTDFDATHPNAPRQFLYFHAIELYMKAFLRSTGMSVDELLKMGHNTAKLEHSYLARGGSLATEVQAVLGLLKHFNRLVIRSRYIETGPTISFDIPVLARAAAALHDAVRTELLKRGEVLR